MPEIPLWRAVGLALTGRLAHEKAIRDAKLETIRQEAQAARERVSAKPVRPPDACPSEGPEKTYGRAEVSRLLDRARREARPVPGRRREFIAWRKSPGLTDQLTEPARRVHEAMLTTPLRARPGQCR